MNNFENWPLRREHSSSVASTTVASTTSSPQPRRPTLEKEARELTERIIKLKCSIAEQKGKQGELHLDWQKLHTERSAIQVELADLDKECVDIRAETSQTLGEIEKAKLRLDQLQTERS